MKLFSSLVLFLFLQVPTDGVEYGPSLSSLTGVFVNWKSPDILALERKVRLANYKGFAVTLPLISRSSEATSEQIFKERGISTVGEFIVEAPKGFGVLAVIQELKFRKTTRDRGTPNATVGCSDYIQFGDAWPDGSSGRSGTVSDKICGTVLKDDLNLSPKSLLGPRTFHSPSGLITVEFNHAYVAELVYSLLGSKQKHILKAEVTFTAYKTNCSDEGPSPSNSNSTSEQEVFKVCSDYKNSDNSTCINSSLLCDEVYNCGGDDDLLGSDDNSESCPDRPARTTITSAISPEDNIDAEDKQSGLSDLSTYLGIPSLSSYTPKKYERKFRPSYVSGSASSGFLQDYRTRRPPPEIRGSSPIPSTTQPSPIGGSIEIKVIGPTRETKTFGSNLASPNSQESSEFDNEIYSRRELSHAINSVIYGVAVFIIFTIFITVFVVCLTKKIQTTWAARHEERLRRRSSVDAEPSPNNSSSNRRRVSSPGNLTTSSVSTTLTIPNDDIRRHSDCNPGHGGRGLDPVVGIVVVEDLEVNDLPPAYASLFPST